MKVKVNHSLSIIIPVYNEEKVIVDCLASIGEQTIKPKEIIVVDDGSTDSSKCKVQSAKFKFKIQNLILLEKRHNGPGVARNFGVKKATGDILVFIDADMTFNSDFLKKLTIPIIKGETKGTFTREEYVSNWDNVWARCWNFNQGLKNNRRIPTGYPDKAPVFRAILKSEFKRVGGFDPIGFTDDWTLSRKLNYQATVAKGAICYHQNPSSLAEVYQQARWIGKNEFYTRDMLAKVISLVRFFPPFSIFRGAWGIVKCREISFIIFKLVYDTGIWISVLLSFFGEDKYR